MTPQMDVTLKTKGDYMLNHRFLNAVTNGIIEKLFISLSEFKYNKLCALLEGIFPGSVSDTNEILGPYPEIDAKDLPKVRDLLLNIPDLQTNKYLSQCLKSVCYIAGNKILARRNGTKIPNFGTAEITLCVKACSLKHRI